jgi:DNA-binding transcriptional regulator YdaS (Cro superfamily)
MTLKEYLEDKSQREFCANFTSLHKKNLSEGYLSQLIHEVRQPSPYLAMLIEAFTDGQVTKHELRPDIFKRKAA